MSAFDHDTENLKLLYQFSKQTYEPKSSWTTGTWALDPLHQKPKVEFKLDPLPPQIQLNLRFK
jgi:hypothetical protein